MPLELTDRQIDDEVIGLVDRARQEYLIGDSSSGADACQALGLGLQSAQLPDGMEGMLTPDGKVIVSTNVTWQPRIEFTIFHEIVHFLLEEDGELIGGLTRAFRSNDSDYQAAIERCCQAGAAEFLMPRSRMREMLANGGISVRLVDEIVAAREVSLIAAAIQIAKYAPVHCYVVVCSHGAIPKHWPPTTGLYVEQSAMPAGMRYPLARFTRIPQDHLLYRVWESKEIMSGESYVPFRSGRRMPCAGAEAKIIGGRVVGILFAGHPQRPGQLNLEFV